MRLIQICPLPRPRGVRGGRNEVQQVKGSRRIFLS